MVTPLPELVTNASSWSKFIHSFTLYGLINTIINLVALVFAFYMLYSFRKYCNYGRDASKEAQEKDRQPLIDRDLVNPVDHYSDVDTPVDRKPAAYNNSTRHNPANRQTVTKTTTKGSGVKMPSVKKDDIKRVGE